MSTKMEGVEINTSKSEHKKNSSKEKFDKEKAKFEKTNEKCVSNEMNIASQDLQFSKTTPDNNNRAGRKPGKDKEIIAKSSKKVLLKEDWSMEKDLIHKKNGSSLVDQIKAGLPIEETDKLEFNLTIEKINTGLQLEIQQAEDIWTEDTSVDLKDKYINFCNSEIRKESTNSITHFLGIWLNTKIKETLIKAKAKEIVRATVISLYLKKLTWEQLAYLNNVCIILKLIYMLQATRLSEHELQKIHRPLLKLIKNKAELQVTTSTSLLKHKGLGNCRVLADELFQKQVISLYKRLNSTGTEALATELRLRQRFNDTRIVNIISNLGKIDNIKKIWKFNLTCLVLLKAEELKFHFNFSSELWQIEQDGTPLYKVLEKDFNRKTADALKRLNLFTMAQLISRKPRWFIALENCLIGDRRNRKLVSEYVISGYNSLALSIELSAVSLNKRKKELVLVENKDDDRKIFKIVQKSKAKILGKYYCNIPLADPNQFEIKKRKGCSRNIAKMIGMVDEKKRTSKKFKSESPTNSLNESLFQGLLLIECLEIELLKKQKLSKALELVLQKSFVRNMESKEQEFFFYTDGSLQLQKENQI
ncbi:41906_t:CDS:2, partial [Gigaspora margarita]